MADRIKVMIVDDSASLRQVVGIALRGAGYEIVEACDGKDALAKLDGRNWLEGKDFEQARMGRSRKIGF